MKNTSTIYMTAIAGMVSLFLLASATVVAAAAGPMQGRGMQWEGRAPGIMGMVSAKDGTTLTVESRGLGRENATTTYTVDASSATVFKNAATSSLENVSVGDRIVVAGTISGTSVTATTIHDGVGFRAGVRAGEQMEKMRAKVKGTSTMPQAIIKGNGQPVVGGDITAIDGSSLTIKNASDVTYAVDASNATTVKGRATSSVSALAVGDHVVVQGAVSGTSVTASSLVVEGMRANASSSAGQGNKPFTGRMMGMIGGFFKHLFGFF